MRNNPLFLKIRAYFLCVKIKKRGTAHFLYYAVPQSFYKMVIKI